MKIWMLAAVALLQRELGARELTILLGISLVAYGLAGWSRELACCVSGAIVLALAWPRSSTPRRIT